MEGHAERYWLKTSTSPHTQKSKSILHRTLILLQFWRHCPAQIRAPTWILLQNCGHQWNSIKICLSLFFFFIILCWHFSIFFWFVLIVSALSFLKIFLDFFLIFSSEWALCLIFLVHFNIILPSSVFLISFTVIQFPKVWVNILCTLALLLLHLSSYISRLYPLTL